MIPIGYLYKVVEPCPRSLATGAVVDVCSLSGCISKPFADYVRYWEHNGFWLFDSPAIMELIARREGVDLSRASLFYYEAYESEFDEASGTWAGFAADASIATSVAAPLGQQLLGYDVVTFSCGTSPECSPLSCNSLANQIPANAHCLFASFADAKRALESGAFDKSEPGPFRIIAVFAIDRPPPTGSL